MDDRLTLHFFNVKVLSMVKIILGGIGTLFLIFSTLIFLVMHEHNYPFGSILALSALFLPMLFLNLRVFLVRNEVSARCYNRVIAWYYYVITYDIATIVYIFASNNRNLSFPFFTFQIIALIYYRSKKEIFFSPWNDNEELFCRKCGSKLITGSLFCKNCGERVQ